MKKILLSVIGVALLCSSMSIHIQNDKYTLASAIERGATPEALESEPNQNISTANIEMQQAEWENAPEEINNTQLESMAPEILTEAPEQEAIIENIDSSKDQGVLQSSKTFTVTITYYCACNKCNGSYAWQDEDGIWQCTTASGKVLSNNGANPYVCATNFGKIGDRVEIDGLVYTILDRFQNGGGSRKIDIFCADGHERCNELGRRAGVTVTLLD